MYRRASSFLVTQLAALAACGDDAPPPDTETTVHVRSRAGAPVPNAPLFFSGADGRLFAYVRTDAAGDARGPMEPGGMVTHAAGTLGGKHQLTTAFGLQPDVPHELVTSTPVTGSRELPVILAPLPERTDRVRLWSDCADRVIEPPQVTGAVWTAPSCAPSGVHVLAYAFDAEHRVLAYAQVSGAASDAESVELSPWAPLERSATITLTGAPQQPDSLHATIAASLGQRVFGDIPQRFPGGDSPSLSFGLPTFGDRLFVDLVAAREVQFLTASWTTSATATVVVADGRDRFLPWISSVAVDPDVPSVSWTPEPGLEQTDLVSVEVAWPDGHWYFQGSPSHTAVSVPQVPDELDIDPSAPFGAAVVYVDTASTALGAVRTSVAGTN